MSGLPPLHSNQDRGLNPLEGNLPPNQSDKKDAKKRKVDAIAQEAITDPQAKKLRIEETSDSSRSSSTQEVEKLDHSLGIINYQNDETEKLSFLLLNTTDPTGLPKSFYVPNNYWKEIGSLPDNIENLNERILATYGQNIYDAATWQIALAMLGQAEIASQQTERLYSGVSGELNIRASSKDFVYGDGAIIFSDTPQNALFFRMISDKWEQIDPLTGKKVTWMDWKPILGENSWAAFIGPLQVAYAKYEEKKKIPIDCIEVKLALNMLPALIAMQSPIGALYHSVAGVHGKDPHEISTENNASLYAGLCMLREILIEKQSKQVDTAISQIDQLLIGIDNFFHHYAYDKKNQLFFQGGRYNSSSHSDELFIPSKDFAVDVQTWGITVLGAKKIDKWFGDGASYAIWQRTKERSGYYDQEGRLLGVGYTDGRSEVLSVEWTCGAILLIKELQNFYGRKNVKDLEKDAITMRSGIESLKEKIIIHGIETVAFHYANKRYSIPFGWWANKIPSLTSTAWVLMIDRNFNPFVLGGKRDDAKS